MGGVPYARLRSLFVMAITSASLCIHAQTPSELRARADATSKQIADIVKNGPDASDESLKKLTELVEELKAIRTELKRLNTQAQPTRSATVSGYLQVQYQSTDRLRRADATGPFDGFRVRRARLNVDADPKDRVHLRVSMDTTVGASQNEFRLREAYARYTAPQGLTLTAGQQILPLGYENERSSYDMEFPERTLLETTYLNGEFSPGVRLQKMWGSGWETQLGIYDSLTSLDSEAVDRNQGAGDKLGGFAAVRYGKSGNRVQLAGFTSKRPAYSPTSAPSANRDFAALDIAIKPSKALILRGEAITGRDRVPGANTTDHQLFGWHGLASLDLAAHQSLSFRYQQLDRNLSADGTSVVGYGLAYTYRWDGDLKLVLSHEDFIDSSRASTGQTRYSETSVRLAARF